MMFHDCSVEQGADRSSLPLLEMYVCSIKAYLTSIPITSILEIYEFCHSRSYQTYVSARWGIGIAAGEVWEGPQVNQPPARFIP